MKCPGCGGEVPEVVRWCEACQRWVAPSDAPAEPRRWWHLEADVTVYRCAGCQGVFTSEDKPVVRQRLFGPLTVVCPLCHAVNQTGPVRNALGWAGWSLTAFGLCWQMLVQLHWVERGPEAPILALGMTLFSLWAFRRTGLVVSDERRSPFPS